MNNIMCNNQGIFILTKEPQQKRRILDHVHAIQDGINHIVEKCHVLTGIVAVLTVMPRVHNNK